MACTRAFMYLRFIRYNNVASYRTFTVQRYALQVSNDTSPRQDDPDQLHRLKFRHSRISIYRKVRDNGRVL